MSSGVKNFQVEEVKILGIKIISDFLIKIGIYPKLKGFDLIISSVSLVLENPSCIHAITTKLYPTIAETFNVSVACVERNMRNAIETAYNSGKLREIANALYRGILPLNFSP